MSCSSFSDERPNRAQRSTASCILSFSMCSVLAWISAALAAISSSLRANSACSPAANARSASNSLGRGSRARDMPEFTKGGLRRTPISTPRRCCRLVLPTRLGADQTLTGCRGNAGPTVRRQSIDSISSANCAGVSTMLPSTIGGQMTWPLLPCCRSLDLVRREAGEPGGHWHGCFRLCWP